MQRVIAASRISRVVSGFAFQDALLYVRSSDGARCEAIAYSFTDG